MDVGSPHSSFVSSRINRSGFELVPLAPPPWLVDSRNSTGGLSAGELPNPAIGISELKIPGRQEVGVLYRIARSMGQDGASSLAQFLFPWRISDGNVCGTAGI